MAPWAPTGLLKVQGAERRQGTSKAQSWPATGHRLAQLHAHHTTPVPSAPRCQQHGLQPEGHPGCLCGDVPRALPEAEGRASEHPSRLGPTQGPPALALSHAAPGQANVRATQGWGTEPPRPPGGAGSGDRAKERPEPQARSAGGAGLRVCADDDLSVLVLRPGCPQRHQQGAKKEPRVLVSCSLELCFILRKCLGPQVPRRRPKKP